MRPTTSAILALLCLTLCAAAPGCAAIPPTLAPRVARAADAPASLPTSAPAPTPPPTSPPQPTSAPQPTPTPPATPTPAVVGYTAYRVRQGDTLESIAVAGGSDPALLLQANHLAATPQPGRELSVPLLGGRQRTIPDGRLMVVRGNTAHPWVALTLDCGNTYGHMGPILEELRAAGARITFFLTGDVVEDSPELVRQMVADRHELADHSYSHPDFTTLTDGEVLFQLRRNELMIREILGPQATLKPYFRFPYGAHDERTTALVIHEGYIPVAWSLDLRDAVDEPKTPEYIVARVMALSDDELRGAIVLGHCTGAVQAALPTLIARLRARGYDVRTLTDVLGE